MMYPKCVPNKFEALPVPPTHMEVRVGAMLCEVGCNGHYNRTPDLGKYGGWWNVWNLAMYTIPDAKVLDCNVTWLTKHKDTS